MDQLIGAMEKKPVGILPNCKGLILVVDGDNTLWDTNSVFEKAQRWLINSLKRARPSVSATLSFEQLRRVDDLLIQISTRHEYDFKLLVLTLLSLQKGIAETNAVSIAVSELRNHPNSEDAKLATKMSKAFRLRLQRIPPLLPCVSSGLEELSQLKTRYRNQLALVLLSEGSKARLEPILGRYFGERKVFDVLSIVERKSAAILFDTLVESSKVIERQIGGSPMQNQLMVVGDSIKSDIEPGNYIGAITVYIPGRYRGAEEFISDRERPKIILKSFCDVPKLAESVLATITNSLAEDK